MILIVLVTVVGGSLNFTYLLTLDALSYANFMATTATSLD